MRHTLHLLIAFACLAACRHAAAGHLEEEARARIDERVEVLQEVAARLRAGERADDMRHLLYALANDDELPAFLHLVDYETLPASHRPRSPDIEHALDRWPYDLPPVILAAYRDVEDALAPGPYRIEEFYWRGILRQSRAQYADAATDLQHYVARTHISRHRTQRALFRVAVIYSRAGLDPPDPRALVILDRMRHDDRVDPRLRQSAAIRVGQIHWKTKRYEESGEAFAWFVAAFPDHELRAKAQLLAAQSYMKAAGAVDDKGIADKHLAAAERILRDLIDLYQSPMGHDVRAEAMYWYADIARRAPAGTPGTKP